MTMNGIDKITCRIEADTLAEIEAARAEALRKRDEITAANQRLAQEKYQQLMREGSRDIQLQSQRLAGAAALEAKKTVLAMKQQVVTSVLEEAAIRICSLPDPDYTAFLVKLAADASFTGQEEIILNAKDKNTVGKAVVKGANELLKKRGILPKLTLSDTAGDFKGGLLVKQGDIVVNCCVETLIETNRDKLASQVAEILFSD